MKFSVLLPVYTKDDPQHFSVAVESLLNQTLMPSEILIVEDGPLTDVLYEVVEKCRKSQPKIVKTHALKKNSGLGIALNEGLKKCRYEHVARMDADDFSVPDRFEKQIKYLEQYPDTIIVGSNIIEYDENLEKQLSVRSVPESTAAIKNFAKTRNPINHVSVIFKKSVIELAGGYQDCLYFEDYFLWLRMIAIGGKMHNIQEPLVKVRGGQSMIARRGGMRYALACYNFLYKAYKLGSISRFDFVKNICIRIPVTVMPSYVRTVIYEKSLRKKDDA